MKYIFEITSYSYSDKLKAIFSLKSSLINLILPIILFCIFYFTIKNEIVRYVSLIMVGLLWIAGILNEFKSYIYKVEFDQEKIKFSKNYLSFKKSYEWNISETKFQLNIPYNSGRLQLRYEILFENPTAINSPSEFAIYDRNWSHEDLYKIYINLKNLKNEEVDKKQSKNLELLEAEVNFAPPF